MKIFRVLLLCAILVSLLSPANTAQASHQILFWDESGTSFRYFGPNETVSIYTGTLDYVCDSFLHTADIYVVPSDSVYIDEDPLNDISGTPNTVQTGAAGGLFIDEIIGFTAPSGKIGPGKYAVVYDECQDGKFNLGVDALFDPAFEVVIPADVSDLPTTEFEKLKADAASEARFWWAEGAVMAGVLIAYNLYNWLNYEGRPIELINFYLTWICSIPWLPKWPDIPELPTSYYCPTLTVQDTIWLNGEMVMVLINQGNHWDGIHADPPDPNFIDPASLGPRVTFQPPTSEALDAAMVRFGQRATVNEATTAALLESVEKYQGADAEGNGVAALMHARNIQRYARLLAESLEATNTDIDTFMVELQNSGRDLEGRFNTLKIEQDRIKAQGLSADEVRMLANIGLTNTDITIAEQTLKDFPFNVFNDYGGIASVSGNLKAQNSAVAISLRSLATAMDSNIVALVAQGMNVTPLADAGGPYMGVEGIAITFSAASSNDPQGLPLTYAWDFDGDGQFDDATGVSPSYTFVQAYTGHVGVKVSNNAGRYNVAYAPIILTETNQLPRLTNLTPPSILQVEIGSSHTFSAAATDPDGDPISITWRVNSVNADSGNIFTFNATPANHGFNMVTVLASDGQPLGGTAKLGWVVLSLYPDVDGDGWRSNVDCDDNDPTVNPEQQEIPLNGKDDDCNPQTSDSGSFPVAFFNPVSSGRNVALLEAGATVNSFSSQFTGAQAPQNMLNHTISDEPWSTGNGLTTNQWVKILLDHGNTYLIDRIRLMPRTDFPTQRVKDFAIDVSTTTADDSAFTTVLTGTAADNDQLQEFLLPSPVFAKYIRYRALNNRGSTCCISTEQLKVMTGQEGGQTVTFQNLSHDPDNDIVSYLWDFGDGITSTEASPTHTFPGAGAYNVTFTVTDSRGQQNSVSLTQRVLLPPTANFSTNPAAPTEGQAVLFADTSTNQPGRITIERNWIWGDGTSPMTTTAPSLFHTFGDNNAYNVNLRVVDSFEYESTITKTLTISNAPPAANAGPDHKWISGIPLDFKVTITDPGTADGPFPCHWDFGDGGSSELCTATHTYTLPSGSSGQSYTAIVTVKDKDNSTGSDSLTVKIGAACTPGPLGISSPSASGDLYYTRYSGTPNVKKVTFSYQNSAFTLGTTVTVATVTGADGIVFSPDGDVLIGGQGNRLHKINLSTGSVTTVFPGVQAYHLSLDSSGTKVWAAGIPGNLAEVPLNPFSNGTLRALTGDDTAVTSLAFDTCGNAFYTSSDGNGNGNFGVIDLVSFTTTRKMTSLPAAHGMAYDAFTGDLLLFGSTHVTQINPANLQIVSDLTVSNALLDQGTADGKGHVYVASNTGSVLFVDYSSTGLIADPRNFKSYVFLDSNLDDVAPLSGPGAPPNHAPILAPISNQAMNAGDTLKVQVVASDLDNDPITLSTGTLPAYGSFVDNGNGSGTLTFNPANADAGSYKITINASDGKQNVSTDFTLTVNPVSAHLIVIKHVINDNGGLASAGDFTMNVSAVNPSLTSFAGNETGVNVTVSAGSFSVTEAGTSGYTASNSPDCVGTIANGETKTCTITNDDQAPKLHLRNVVINDNGGTALATAWTLSADGLGANDLSGVNPVDSGATLKADTFTLSESGGPAGYTASNWVCVGDTQNGNSVTLSLGQEATCTITNDDQPATLIIKKVVINNDGGTKNATDFTFQVNGGSTIAFQQDTDIRHGKNTLTVDVGTFNVVEADFAGYTTTYDNCSNVVIPNGGSATCTITNDDQPGTLVVKKVVTNDNGGTRTAGDFEFSVNNGVASDVSFLQDNDALHGKNTFIASAGTYTVTEDGLPIVGYITIYKNCSNVVIPSGGLATCTITNDDIAPKLHLRKVVVNDNGGTAPATSWTLSADGAGANDLSGTTPVDSGTSLKVDTFVLSETGGPAGYRASDWICVGGTQNGSNITLGLGQEATCTITNDDIAPKLHLRKAVVNDNGGTKTVADFTLTANGTGSNDLSGTSPVDAGAGLKADTWALSETNLYGYSASVWICVGGAQNGSNVTLSIGEEATCTITNDDKPGTIIIIKNAKPAQGSFAFTTIGTGYNGFTLTGATTNNGNKNTHILNAGNYTVKESTQLAWILTGIGGSTDPNTPYACTVLGSGGSTGVGDLSTQTAAINLKNGDTVTCVFENTGQGATRTQGFWATHSQLARIAWFGGTAFAHTFPGVASVAGISDRTICGRAIEGPGTNDISKVIGGFWSDVSKTSTGAKRSALDQARMQLLQQLLAAELNASAFGSVPSGGSGMFAQWESALCGTNTNAIKNAMQQAASFNTQGDSSTFTPGTSADSKYARSIADIKFWDIIKP